MALPYFYIAGVDPSQKEFELDEDTSRHVVQVLRMKEGERLNLTDGKGVLIEAEITSEHKKHCSVRIIESRLTSQVSRKVKIAISLLKNTSRFEWFLEKVTEIGVSEIVPVICERTEKQKFRHDRMKGICISAMLQSQQTWLPALNEPKQFNHFTIEHSEQAHKFIAHCNQGEKTRLSSLATNFHSDPNHGSSLILIGPEGDFTNQEVNVAVQNGFVPVSLGDSRLRTETAGVVAAVLLTIA